MPCSQNDSRTPSETFAPGAVVAVERQAEVVPELRAVGLNAGAELIERPRAACRRIGRRLQHQRRHGADQHCLRHALGAVAADIAGDLAAAGRVADVDGVLEVELLDQFREIVGVGVHVVAVPRLARAAMAAAIMGDAAIAARREEEHLVLEGVGAERPAMAEDDRLSRAPVLVVNLRPVLGGDR